MIEKPTEEDLRYLNYYEKLDSRRTASWLKNKPTELSPRGRERLGLKSNDFSLDSAQISPSYFNKQETQNNQKLIKMKPRANYALRN